MGWTATVGLLLAAVFFLKLAPEFSRAWLALWYLGGARRCWPIAPASRR